MNLPIEAHGVCTQDEHGVLAVRYLKFLPSTEKTNSFHMNVNSNEIVVHLVEDKAIQDISNDSQGGFVIYMAGHEGRGIGLWAKAATYILQDEGENTYQANRSLGLDEDSRDFSDAATLIKHFYGNKPFRLLTNNPKKIDDLKDNGLETITPMKHIIGVTGTNREYLFAKKDWGHTLEDKDISED